MKNVLIFVLGVLSLVACAPSINGSSDGIPFDRSKSWVLVNGDVKQRQNYYALSFSSEAPIRTDKLIGLNMTATQFSSKAEFPSTAAYDPKSGLLYINVFLEEPIGADAQAVNCALVTNDDAIDRFQPTDWIGVGSMDTPKTFLGRLNRLDKNLDFCAMLDRNQFTNLVNAPKDLGPVRSLVFERNRTAPHMVMPNPIWK
jgi:hypothetical protein